MDRELGQKRGNGQHDGQHGRYMYEKKGIWLEGSVLTGPERQPTNGVIECFFRNPEKKRHKPSAIRSADKFRCCRAAKTRGVTSTISVSEWPRLCLRSVTQVFSTLLDRPQWTE
jgi:hypothetical protein